MMENAVHTVYYYYLDKYMGVRLIFLVVIGL